jgi:heme oxygenase
MKHPLLAEVKEKTKPHHDKIEMNPYAVAISTGTITPEQYLSYLKKFYGFLAVTESSISKQFTGSHMDTVIKARMKAPLLLADLEAMGVPETDTGSISLCKNLPNLDNLNKVLGYMYVIEGSTLGGQIVSQQLRKVLGPGIPLNYFDCYGKETGARWISFCEILTSRVSEENKEEFINSACDTFIKLDLWFNHQ